MFIPEKKELTEQDFAEYRELYRSLASALLEAGVSASADVDMVTGSLLRKYGIMPEIEVPFTLGKIAGYDKSTPRNS